MYVWWLHTRIEEGLDAAGSSGRLDGLGGRFSPQLPHLNLLSLWTLHIHLWGLHNLCVQAERARDWVGHTHTQRGLETGWDTHTQRGLETGWDTHTHRGLETGWDTHTQRGLETGWDTHTQRGLETGWDTHTHREG